MLGLRVRIVAWVTALVVCTAALCGWTVLQTERAGHAAARAGEARQVAVAMAAGLPEALASGHATEVARQVNQAGSRGAGLRVTVRDIRGVALGQPGPEPLLNSAEPGSLITAPILDARGARLGVVEVALDDPGPAGPVARDLADLFRAIGTPAFELAVGLVVLVAFLAAGLVTTPLAGVAGALARFSRGDFGVSIPERSAGAIGPITRGINALAPQLDSVSAQGRFVNSILCSMVDSLVVIDQQARIQAVNPATLEMLGYTEAELLGRAASLICLEDGFFLSAAHLEKLLGESARRDHEVSFVTKDGRRIPVSLSGSAIRDGAGNLTGYVCIGTDITRRKSAEADREALHKQLLSTSRQAGMAEVATGVLHNVGNVLNSVNIAASMARQTVRRSKMDRLGQVAQLVASRRDDLPAFLTADERGRAVPEYLAQLAAALADEHRTITQELDTLADHVAHIRDIVSVQQSVSRVSGVLEDIRVGSLVDDAIRMVSATVTRDQITLERAYEDLTIRVDKHRVLQILVNLVTNAAEATREVPERQGLLRVRAGADPARPGTARIEITDNGGGIAPENLPRVFSHGFTTKKDGHGFGLHTSAVAAQELGGSLTAHSEGSRRGATFVLHLPVQAQEAAA